MERETRGDNGGKASRGGHFTARKGGVGTVWARSVRWVCKCSAGAVAPLPKREWGRAGETRSFGLDDGECETCVQESGGYARMESLPKNMHWAGTWERVGGKGVEGAGSCLVVKQPQGHTWDVSQNNNNEVRSGGVNRMTHRTQH